MKSPFPYKRGDGDFLNGMTIKEGYFYGQRDEHAFWPVPRRKPLQIRQSPQTSEILHRNTV